MTSPRLHSWPGRAALSRRPFRVASRDRPFLDLFSRGRAGPSESRGFSAAQIGQIQRTVMGRTPEVMVKVTGGGRRVGAVAAHLSYISQHGKLDLETDDGQHVFSEGQKELLRSWHLELTRGQYRQPRGESVAAAGVKLVHNVTLSMPAPTPPAAVLAAAKAFAREKFGAKHRYAMALHTHQRHPHVHLVVKAEGIDGRRLHIDKAMLREWRQDFARMMREQGIAANATPRSVRGQTKRAAKDVLQDPASGTLLCAAREARRHRTRASRNDAYHRAGASEAARDAKGGRRGLERCRLETGGAGRDRPRRPRPVLRHASAACADGPGAAGGAVHSLCEGAQIAEDTRRRPGTQPHTGTDMERPVKVTLIPGLHLFSSLKRKQAVAEAAR